MSDQEEEEEVTQPEEEEEDEDVEDAESEDEDEDEEDEDEDGDEDEAKNDEQSKKKRDRKSHGGLRPDQLPDWIYQKKRALTFEEGGILPKTPALGRYIRWPRNIIVQRKKKILLQRLKIPPALNIFRQTIPKEFSSELYGFMLKYRPETRPEKRQRLRAWAKLQEEGKELPTGRHPVVRYGFRTVTKLIESGKARLVIIAHDVDPVELVLWMPSLCVLKDTPFVVFRSKSRLGTVVHKKTTSCACITDVRPGDEQVFQSLQEQARKHFNDRYDELKRTWGQKTLSRKTLRKIEERRKRAAEMRKKRREAMRQSRMKGERNTKEKKGDDN